MSAVVEIAVGVGETAALPEADSAEAEEGTGEDRDSLPAPVTLQTESCPPKFCPMLSPTSPQNHSVQKSMITIRK